MKKHQAFTLMELLIVCIVISVMLVITVPFAKSFSQKRQSMLTRQQLLQALEVARAEAVALGHAVLLKSEDRYDWSQGYDIEDVQTQRLIRHFQPNVVKNARLIWKDFTNKPNLCFLSDGQTDSQNGSFYYTINQSLTWKIIVNKAGRAHFE